tara:strand:+ start:620 stop:805 length:186 start_codon:yes stop_codon:yes gene_type:complete
MKIENAKYHKLPVPTGDGELISISCKVDGVLAAVPLDKNNYHYEEILRQVDAGKLTIADAE